MADVKKDKKLTEMEKKKAIVTSIVQDMVRDKADMINGAPLFIKPAYYLDRFAPLLKIIAVIPSENFGAPPIKMNLFSSEPGEGEELLRQFGYAPDVQHNNLTTFKYDTKTQEVTFSINDLKEDVVEILWYRYMTLAQAEYGENKIRIDIEFGWSPPKLDLSPAEKERVFFTNTIRCTLNDVEIKHEGGFIKADFKATYHFAMDLPGDLRYFKPFENFGPYPAVMMEIENTLVDIANILGKASEGFSQGDPITFELLVEALIIYFASQKSYKDPKQLKILLNEIAFAFFSTDQVVDIRSQFINAVQELSESEIKALTQESAGANVATNTRLAEAIAPDADILLFREEYKNNEDLLNNTLFEDLYNLFIDRSAQNQLNKSQSFGKYLLDTRKNTSHPLNKLLHPLAAIAESQKVDPNLLYEYCLDVFQKGIKTSDYKDRLDFFFIDFIDDNDILTNSSNVEKLLKSKAKANKSKVVVKAAQVLKAKEDFVFIKTSTIKISHTTDWSHLFSMISNKIQIVVQRSKFEKAGVTPPSVAHNFERKPDEPSGKTKQKNSNPDSFPIETQTNTFIATPKIALKNLKMIQTLNFMSIAAGEKNSLEKRHQTFAKENRPEVEAVTNAYAAKLKELSINIKDAIDKAKKYESDDEKEFLFVIRSPLPTQTMFNSYVGNQKIWQAYSYRMNQDNNEQFNPGYPTVWDVNFPDVLSLSVKFDYKSAYGVLQQNLRYEIDDRDSNQKIISIVKLSVKEANIKLKKLKDDFGKWKKQNDKYKWKGTKNPEKWTVGGTEIYKGGERKYETKAWEKGNPRKKIYGEWYKNNFDHFNNKIAETGKQLEAAKSEETIKKTQELHNKFGFRNNINLSLDRNSIHTHKYDLAIENKRQAQKFREVLLLQHIGEEAELRIVGDPSYVGLGSSEARAQSLGGYIFIKAYKSDGKLNNRTGLYTIHGAAHSITAGTFETTLSLRKTTSAEGPNIREQLATKIRDRDAIVVIDDQTSDDNYEN